MIREFSKRNIMEVVKPNLYKEIFPYDELPKSNFNNITFNYDIPDNIWITDTTFRDGQQSMESFTVDQIETIFKFLHKLDNNNGIIKQTEFFLYSKRDREAVKRCQSLGYDFPQITSWIRPLPEDIKIVKDFGIKESGLLMSCSDYHIFGKLNKTRNQVFNMYISAVEKALEYGIKPRCHLEDITRADLFGFVIPLINNINELGIKAGVEIKFRLCDTLGVAKPFNGQELPRSVPALVYYIKNYCNLKSLQLEWHGHNDYYYAVANSTTAWLHGTASVNTTLLGIGERTGNCPLEAMLIEYCQMKEVKNEIKFDILNDIAKYFEDELNFRIHEKMPFIGKEFNSTRAGIHADGLLKNEDIYNSVNTRKIFGRPIKIVVNQFSGQAGIAAWINSEFDLKGEDKISKKDKRITLVKKWIDEQYENKRTTAISDMEMKQQVLRYFDNLFNEKQNLNNSEIAN